jgi:O-antigen/teichoic acid export membrane protein/aminoglycoside phosphotransferase (APT) family kinase protein
VGSEVGTSECAPASARPLVLDWEHAKVGDRLASFTIFLPAHPIGGVLLAVSPMLGNGLRWRFDDAVLLARTSGTDHPAELDGVRSVGWDGQHLPVRPGSFGLLIVDTRHADPEVLRPALAAGGTLAVLGSDGDLVIYPDVDRPENIWKPGWPIPAMPSVRAQVRRTVGLRSGVRRERIKLRLDGPPEPSLIDELLVDLEAQTGRPGTVVGVQTAGDTIVRVRQPDRELAIRLSLTAHDRNFAYGATVADEVPAIRDLVQRPVASGRTCGAPWVATEWLPRRRRSPLELRRVTRRQWSVAHRLTVELQKVPTDVIDDDWARRWCDAVAPIVEKDNRQELQAILADVPLGMPTAWAHGDLWPGNILVDHADVAVIDWENCARDAPIGLDALLVAALRARNDEGISVATACARMIDEPNALSLPVGGRQWSQWERAQRAALATAAYVLHLRNRALFDVGYEALDRDIAVVVAAARGVTPPLPPALPTPELPADGGGAGRTARGALWLGSSALVVKALQTVILLVLAALLAPSALGLVAIGSLVMNISTVISDLGTSNALVYFRGDVNRAARSAVTVAAILGLAVTAVAWLVAPALTHVLHVDDEGIDVIRGLTSVLPFYAVATVHLELLRRKLDFARRIVPDVVAAIVGAAVSIVLAAQGHGVSSLVIGQIVQGVLLLVIAWLVSKPVMPGWNMADVRALIGYGGHMSGSNLAQLAMLNIDYLIVSRVLGATSLGEYSIAFRLAYLPYLNIAVVIGGASFPYLCRLRGEKLGLSTERIAGLTITAVVPLCAGIALLAEQLELLGRQWAPAVPVVRWLMVYTVILSAGQLVQVALNSSGRPRTTLGLRVLHLCALAVALVILTKHGITAVAIGQVVAVVLVTGVAGVLATRHLAGFHIGRLLRSLAPALVGVVTMAAIVLALRAWLPGADVSAGRLVVLGLAGLIAYAVPVWLLDRERIVQTAALLRGGR